MTRIFNPELSELSCILTKICNRRKLGKSYKQLVISIPVSYCREQRALENSQTIVNYSAMFLMRILFIVLLATTHKLLTLGLSAKG
jgi:hypothetical protein